MNDYKVSVITPFYNNESYLKRTFDSVLNQTFNFEDIEYIFIDDKSTDSSKDIVQSFCDEYDNVKLYDSPKGKKGPGVSRNMGLDKATADYVVFLDSDDRMDLKYIETMYDEITHSTVDLVKSAFYVDAGGIVNPLNLGIGRVEVSHDDLSQALVYNYLEPWCTIYRKDYLIENNIRFLDKFCVIESFLFAIKSIANAKNGLILLDDYFGQYWTIRDDSLHNEPVKGNDLGYVLECLSDAILLLYEQDQPQHCVEKFLNFILSIWCMNLFNCKEPKELIDEFIFAKGFKSNQI